MVSFTATVQEIASGDLAHWNIKDHKTRSIVAMKIKWMHAWRKIKMNKKKTMEVEDRKQCRGGIPKVGEANKIYL